VDQENNMKSATIYSAMAGAVLLASTQLVPAQGTSGSTGAVASIPGSVVRGGERGRPVTQPGLISILTGSAPTDPNADSKKNGVRRGVATAPPK
jgi:hypothetical protein